MFHLRATTCPGSGRMRAVIWQLTGGMVDADGAVVWRKKVRRGAEHSSRRWKVPACLVGMEACATAHYWAREISARGHEVRLMPPAYVKAYLRRQKNDASDAEAICEAVRRPTMRFVGAKSTERQAVLVLHRSRELLVRQRTMLINAIRGHCAEFGLVAAQGMSGSRDLVERIRQADSAVLPDMAKDAMVLLVEQLHALVRQIQTLNRRLLVCIARTRPVRDWPPFQAWVSSAPPPWPRR